MKAIFSSFSTQSTDTKEASPTPLTVQFFNQLIKYEIEFANESYTADLLNKLTQCYSQAVEYYDSIKDPISTYFMFKIQDALTTKKSIKILIKQSAKDAQKEANQTLKSPDSPKKPSNQVETSCLSRNNTIDQLEKGKVSFKLEIPSQNIESGVYDSSEDEEEEKKAKLKAIQRKQTAALNRNLTHRRTMSLIKSKKQKMFTLQIKLQSEKAHAKQNLTEVLTTYGDSTKQIDKVVQNDIDQQKNKIRDKIANRKKQICLNLTENSSSSNHVKGADATTENLSNGLDALDDLDDQDEIQNHISIKSIGNGDDLEEHCDDQKEKVFKI